ncbi:MAG: ComF family protein [Lachnospirales bacterium]
MKNEIIDFLLDLVYPPKCYNCKKLFKSNKNKFICPKCEKLLLEESKKTIRCPICSKAMSDIKLCGFCHQSKVYHNHSIFTYDGFYKKAIYEVKYSENKGLCKALALMYTEYLIENKEYFKTFDYIVPVPLHKNKLRKRGFNQSSIMAKNISDIIKVPYIDILERTVNTKALSKYNKDERIEILKNVFVIRKLYEDLDLTNKKILIVDDIYTTGSTINECCKVLENKNIKEIESLCIVIR